MGDSQYSFSLTTFSPSGKLVQIEHALTAVGSGQTSLGIKDRLLCKKPQLSLFLSLCVKRSRFDPSSPSGKLVQIEHALTAVGSAANGVVIATEKKLPSILVDETSVQKIQLLTPNIGVVYSGVRPFGVSLLVAGFDDKGPQLYQVDPSGSYFSWKASAMGKNVSNAKTFLEKRYTDDMELDDAVHTSILTLKEGVLTPAEIDDYLAEVE
ncbi:proteasome subunit alpha type-2-a [Quercus suber]|uniref:Proteasome subunit alpha type n=1 Tax=Quercus suber TaxID=58331 RepID=A0AAW0LID5_QUESU